MKQAARIFEAPTLPEAMAKVVENLGRDAVILSTRMTSRKAFLGLLERPCAEVVACREGEVRTVHRELTSQSIQRSGRPSSGSVTLSESGKSKLLEQAYRITKDNKVNHDNQAMKHLHAEIKSLKSMVMDVMRMTRASHIPSASDAMAQEYLRLVENEVSEDLARDLLTQVNAELKGDELHDARLIRIRLIEHLGKHIPSAGPISLQPNRSRVVAIIGPTGVGKTTTLAKLAAHYSLRERQKVGLITLDIYRIAAVDQLRTYAGIINIPLEVASSLQELNMALRKLGHCDLVLLDSAGRNQQDTLKMNELARFLDAAAPDETHLVVDVGMNRKRIMDVADRFGRFKVNRVIFSKLDEASNFGVVPSVLRRLNRPLSYVTTGQNVPDDIAVGLSSKMARLVIGERWESWKDK